MQMLARPQPAAHHQLQTLVPAAGIGDRDNNTFANPRRLLQRRLRAAEILQRAGENDVVERPARKLTKVALSVALYD